jgi:hypothetical protein
MDSYEAKRILAFYRPGDTKNIDERMAEALALARTEPELAAWFGQHCAALAQAGDKPVIPRTSLENKPSGVESKPETDQAVPAKKPALYWVVVALLVVTVLFVWSFFAPKPENTYSSFRNRMARMVQRSYPIKMGATEHTRIRDYFRTNAGVANFELPRNLEKLPGLGGAVFTWHSEPVSLVGLDGGGATNLYVFLIKRSVFGDHPVPKQPVFMSVGSVMTVGWTVGDEVYLLTGPDDETIIKNYLE